MKKISIVSGCFNEKENIPILYERLSAVAQKFDGKYLFEFIVIDNASTDGTDKVLREIAAQDNRLKVIINTRNFGHVRSPYYGILQSSGDATVYLASDLQDPPELIEKFILEWEKGVKIVVAQKEKSEECKLMYFVREMFYSILTKFAQNEITVIKQYTGFGLYDREIVDLLRKYQDPYPYLRGQICEYGYEKAIVKFTQPTRKFGKTKNDFYTLFDNAMLGFVRYSKVPLRLMTFLGFLASLACLFLGTIYLILKLLAWNTFDFGLAPLIISMFFIGSIQLFCMGILGEYLGAIYTKVDNKPLIIEKERINF